MNKLSCFLLIASFLFIGCGRAKPKAPALDPSGMAAKAIELYDANGNGKIDGDEFDKTPALKFALKEIDADKDKALSADEIQKRLEAWQASGITLTAPLFQCKIGGKTVKEGTMKLTPEPFLGETFPAAEGTFVNGACQPGAPNAGNYQAIPVGFYTVEVSSPTGTISAGQCGVEVFDDSDYFQRHGKYLLSE
ncbi:MAG: hypothetical protein Q4A17_12515 [Thermoguttaceae bacterium]|nr:hypothetical protein [Thermoguttaceae bacterium]